MTDTTSNTKNTHIFSLTEYTRKTYTQRRLPFKPSTKTNNKVVHISTPPTTSTTNYIYNELETMFKSLKFYSVKYITIFINLFLKTFRIGGGYTWPGHIALALYPSILQDSNIHFKRGLVLISGTNGKTTTTSLLTHIISGLGHSVTTNKSGANLLNGIVSAVLLDGHQADFGVFEVDEFSLPLVLKFITPDYLVLLNLSRDQLDRYGETDIILERWVSAITSLANKSIVILDSDSSELCTLPGVLSNKTYFFDADSSLLGNSNLSGEFNAKNINAAFKTLELLAVNLDSAKNSLKSFTAAYGRGEVIINLGTRFRLYLAKNPASFNRNLALSFDEVHDCILIVLNDNTPDGRDISWVYDIDPIKLYDFCDGQTVYVSGTRAEEMALRLTYASVKVTQIIPSLKSAVAAITEEGFNFVLCFPNYSSMLQLRKLLIGRKIL